MAFSSSNLLQWIAYSEYLLRQYGCKLLAKIEGGVQCPNEEKNLLTATWYIKEVKYYYDDCSCLTEAQMCAMLTEIQRLLK